MKKILLLIIPFILPIFLNANKYIFIGKVIGIYKNNNIKIASSSSYIPEIGEIVSIYRGKQFLTNGYIIAYIGRQNNKEIYLIKTIKKANIRIGDKAYIENPNYEEATKFYEEKKINIKKPKYRIVSLKDQKEMVLIPGGYFYMGRNDGEKDEYPLHLVYVASFYIDRYEVSNLQYKQFIDDTGYPPPSSWKGDSFPTEEADLPVYPVSFKDAYNYCIWAGKRLPTEEEWEKAGRGDDVKLENKTGKVIRLYKKILYPWGNNFFPMYVNYSGYWKMFGKSPRLTPIYSFSKGVKWWEYKENGKTVHKEAIYNLLGNVWEWVDSWYKAYPGSTFFVDGFGEKYKVIRGGAFFSKEEDISLTKRFYGGIPTLDTDYIAGFRCAISLDKTNQYVDYSNYSELIGNKK
jgi:formylglycine-generating enzyme required for sulfatase activity